MTGSGDARPGGGGTVAAAEADAGSTDSRTWRTREAEIRADRPLLLGVLNVTPDSFYDGGRYLDPGDAVRRAEELAEAGADLIDVGGESTRPGATPVPPEEQWDRIGPVLDGLSDLPVPVSVDTRSSSVAARALEAGASVINDVSGLRSDPELADVAADFGAGLIVMHMRGTPRTMQRDTYYGDLVAEVKSRLEESLGWAVEAGCRAEQVVVDPGIGFGKSLEGNLRLLAELGALEGLGRPILVGPSRKSFIGHLLDLPEEERLEGTIAACTAAYERGARLFRVHDVRAVRRALDVAEAVRAAEQTVGDERRA